MQKNETVLHLVKASHRSKKIYSISMSVLVMLTLQASASINEISKDVIVKCENNFLPDQLDPAIAAECLMKIKPAVLYKGNSAQDKPRADALLARTNALKDLALQIGNSEYEVYDLSDYLGERLRPNFPLSQLGLGPEPEKLIPWVLTYFPGHEIFVKDAIRDWGSLDSARLSYLVKLGINEEKWQATNLQERQEIFAEWAEEKAKIILENDSATITQQQLDNLIELKKLIRRDTSIETLQKIKNKMTSLKNEVTDSSESDQHSALSIRFKHLKDIHTGNQSAQSLGTDAAQEQLTKEEGEQITRALAPALRKALSDTTTGKITLAFYQEKAARLGLSDITDAMKLQGSLAAGINAEYNPGSKAVYLSLEVIQRWMIEKHYDLNSLLNSEARLDELAEYFAPSFVHETTHARQCYWEEQHHFHTTYIKDKEVEAYAMKAIFTLEKEKLLGPAYLSSMMEQTKDEAEKFRKEGMAAFSGRASQYSSLASFEAYAADEFDRNRDINLVLAKRTQNALINPSLEAAADKQRMKIADSDFDTPWNEIKTADLKKKVKEKATLAWYQAYRQRVFETERFIQDQWAALTTS